MALYAASGVLGFLYPELDALVNCPREPGGDWFAHSLRTIDLLARHRPALRWAALLQGAGAHDGSSGAGEEGNDPHERALRRSAAVLEGLRSSNAMVSEVAGLTQWIARPPGPEASDEELRRWLSAAGRNTLNSRLRIWIACLRADEAWGGSLSHSQFMELCRRLRAISRSGAPLTVAELVVSGRDLIRQGMQAIEQYSATLHCMHNQLIEIDGDEARGDTWCIANHIHEKDGVPHKLDWGIRYKDHYRREASGWKIARRELVLVWQQDLVC